MPMIKTYRFRADTSEMSESQILEMRRGVSKFLGGYNSTAAGTPEFLRGSDGVFLTFEAEGRYENFFLNLPFDFLSCKPTKSFYP